MAFQPSPTFEQQAVASTLAPLGDYVMDMGIDRPLAAYSKTEIEGLIRTVVMHYQRILDELYQQDIPF